MGWVGGFCTQVLGWLRLAELEAGLALPVLLSFFAPARTAATCTGQNAASDSQQECAHASMDRGEEHSQWGAITLMRWVCTWQAMPQWTFCKQQSLVYAAT